jgi:hypothetical protein
VSYFSSSLTKWLVQLSRIYSKNTNAENTEKQNMKNDLRKRKRMKKEGRDFQSHNLNTISNSNIANLWNIPSQSPWLRFETEKKGGKRSN